MGQWLSERLGQQFVIDNRPAASGNIATEAVVRAPPDGYTLLLFSSSAATNAALYDKLNFISSGTSCRSPALLSCPTSWCCIHRFRPRRSLSSSLTPKVIQARSTMASGGWGTLSHLEGELFKMMTGVNMVHVPYRGQTPALTDLLAGQVQVLFNSPPASIEYIKAGRLRALAVTTATRSETLPGIPTVGEFVPGFEASHWFGIGAPRNTPAEIVDKLNKEINAALADPNMKARLADLGGTVLVGSPADFGKLMTDDTGKWSKVIKFADIKPE